jgi:hypothetical protein
MRTSAQSLTGGCTLNVVTELIVRELRLRRFDGVVPVASARSPATDSVGDAGHHRTDEPRVERLAARHSRRRIQAGELDI